MSERKRERERKKERKRGREEERKRGREEEKEIYKDIHPNNFQKNLASKLKWGHVNR
jgi:hypothetical protein